MRREPTSSAGIVVEGAGESPSVFNACLTSSKGGSWSVCTAELKDRTLNESTAPTTVFRDDETIAEFLISMSQTKAKQKGVEIKDAEDSDRPRATSTRSLAKDEEIARKVQEDWEAEEEMKKLVEKEATKAALIQDFDDIQAELKLIDF
ncbi:hypothetical protein Tco_0025375 [Tanacetum coccineum]